MKRYFWICFGLCLLMLGIYGLVEALQISVFQDPAFIRIGGLASAAGGIALLAVDIVFPVPSSLVMIGMGAAFGLWTGTLLSLVGCMMSASIGFAIGRKGTSLVNRLMTEQERAAANRFFQEWGTAAVIISRPLPILAETVSLIAGTSHMSWAGLLLSAFAGSLPSAAIYAWCGATAKNFDSLVWSFCIVLTMAGVFWMAGRILSKRR